MRHSELQEYELQNVRYHDVVKRLRVYSSCLHLTLNSSGHDFSVWISSNVTPTNASYTDRQVSRFAEEFLFEHRRSLGKYPSKREVISS